MIEIVINRCRHGTLLSEEGFAEFAARKGVDLATVSLETIDRTDPVLVQMMKEKPHIYGGHCGHPLIVTVEDGFPWKVMSKGTFEWVAARA